MVGLLIGAEQLPPKSLMPLRRNDPRDTMIQGPEGPDPREVELYSEEILKCRKTVLDTNYNFLPRPFNYISKRG